MSSIKKIDSKGSVDSPSLAHQEYAISTTASACHDVDASDLRGLTPYQQKCILINRHIEAQGMGRYDWYIWLLCGFGYFLDLLWAQAFGLVLSPLQQELGFGNSQSGNISVSFSAGLTAGAFFWGFLTDIIGNYYLPFPYRVRSLTDM